MAIYKDIVDAIMHAKFPLIVPESYVPHLPEAYLEKDAPDLIFEPNEFERVRVLYPTTYIADMYVSKVDFEFVRSSDIYEVHRLLEWYLTTYATSPEALNDPDTKLFIDRAKKTYEAFNRRVTIKNRAKPTNAPLNLIEAMKILNGGN